MSIFDRLLDWAQGRQDAVAPRLQLAGPVVDGEARRADSTYNPLTGLGGWKDKGSVGRPSPFVRNLSDRDLDNAYTNSGITRRIVDLLPDEATRKGWSCPHIPATEDQRLNVYETYADAGKMGRLYGGGAVLLVTDDDVPPAFRQRPEQWLAEPLDLERVGALLAIHVFDGIEAQPTQVERDVREPGYRMPRIWSFGADGFSARVHASRVVYFRGAKRPPSQAWGGWSRRSNLMPDDSIIQALWEQILHVTETHKGGAVLAQELSESVLTIASLGAQTTGDQNVAFARLMDRLQQAKSVLKMIILGSGDTYERKATPVTGFKDLSEASQAMLSTVLGWPRSMLSGEAPAGLGTDDAAGLERERKIVSTYQEQRLRRPLEQLYTVVYSAQDGPTRGIVPDEWALQFHPLNEPTDQEVADLRKTVAETDVLYITSGVYGPEEVAKSRFGAEGWNLDLEEVPVPDPDEEAALAAAQAAMQDPGADPGQDG